MQLFDRASANRLIPELERLMTAIVSKRQELLVLQQQLQGSETASQLLFAPEEESMNNRVQELDDELRRLIRQVQATGGVVKDLGLGLVDFPAIIDREPVYLCWRLGEKEIAWYHSVDSGFTGRLPLP